ncbi:MAG: calcium-binding protein, partial [Candidatus Binatia bacterium]
LTDTLALADVFGQLDSQLTLATVNKILNASSANTESSLENALDGLRKLFLDAGDKTLVGDADRQAVSRVDYHTKLSELRTHLEQNGIGNLSVVSLTDKTADQLESEATSSIATRYALVNLNPFAIQGFDYSQLHNANGELDLYNSATGEGSLTLSYLEDRAHMLFWSLFQNEDDGKSLRNQIGAPVLFEDKTRDYSVAVGGLAEDGTQLPAGSRRIIAFGGAAANSLSGSNNADRLYGGDGKDQLAGRDGNDHLEGGEGDDTLDGGRGSDTYYYLGREGQDVIIDEDGQGTVDYSGINLSGEKTLVPNTTDLYTDGTFTYHYLGRSDQDGILIITKDSDPDGKVTIQNFTNGELGITLSGEPVVQPYVDKFGSNASDNSASTQPGHAGTLTADAPYQKVYGFGGNDLLQLETEGAQGYGGIGNDFLRNGVGDQQLFGEENNDILIASSGDDELYGGLDNDALQGGDDNDYLEGHDGNDFLDGGAGSDVIYGGAGHDFIVGGGSMVPNLSAGQIDDPNA